MALESTASDALHELRLLLRTLRQTEPALGRSIETSTGLGHAVTDLGEAIRVISDDIAARSEEHTSELQSRINLVCRLLLEKKK